MITFFLFLFFFKETTRPFKLLIMTRVRQAISGHAWDDVSSSPLSRGVSLREFKMQCLCVPGWAWSLGTLAPSPLSPKRASPPPPSHPEQSTLMPTTNNQTFLPKASSPEHYKKKRNIKKSKGSLARSVTLQCRMSRVKVANQGVRITRYPKGWYINRNYFTSTALLRYRSFVRCIYLGAVKAGTLGT